MALRDVLTSLVRDVDGCLAAIVMAYDGLAIEEVTNPGTGIDLQLLSVEYATVLKEIKRAVDVIRVGEMEEVVITTSDLQVVMRVLNEELFAVLILAQGTALGKPRYLLRLRSFDVLRELE